MMMKARLVVGLSILLVLSLGLAGCGQRVTAEEIVARMQQTVESTEDAYAVVSASVDAQGIQMSATAKVWEKSPRYFRVEVLEASQPGFEGAVAVTDGQEAWYYDPGRNVVLTGPAGEVEMPLPQEMLLELQETIQYVLDASDVSLAGEEVIAGHETYKLTLSPKEEEGTTLFPGNGTATLWVDKEEWFVLRAQYEAGSFGQGSLEVQEYALNPGLSVDLFAFQVPDGAEVVEMEAHAPIPLTLEEAKAEAGFPLLLPDYVPGNATLIEVFKSGDAIILRYDHSPDVAFTVVQGREPAAPPSFGGQQDLAVRGYDATAVTDEVGGNTFLYWTENGVTISVAGHIDLAEALQVAESLR
jgi:outer membrane lipoprotein-sorting protein